ncbi:MAG: hypothetical protein ACXVDD_03495, partial [Polyangia bacterium]
GALVKLPSPADLVAAVRGNDDVEIERVAARIGAVRLEAWAEHGKPPERLAALRALPLVDDAWAVLPELARLIGDGDEEVAAHAAACARQIAEGLTPERKESDEMPGDIPARAARELLAAAQKASLKPALRVTAIEAAAALRAVTRIDDKGMTALLGDRDATVRRAAAEGLAAVPAADKPLEEALVKDSAADVAAAAAASLCRDVPLIAPSGRASTGELRAGKLGAPARERLRVLALDEKVPLADRLDLIGCLRVGKKDADQKVLDELARKPPEPLRRRARALGGR